MATHNTPDAGQSLPLIPLELFHAASLPEGSSYFQEVMAEFTHHSDPQEPKNETPPEVRQNKKHVHIWDVHKEKDKSQKVKDKKEHTVMHGMSHCYIVQKGDVTGFADYRCNHDHVKQRSPGSSPRLHRQNSITLSSEESPRPHRKISSTISPQLSLDESLRPHRKTSNTVAPHISPDESLRPHRKTSNTVAPHIPPDESLRPHRKTSTTVAPQITSDESLRPHRKTSTTVAPQISSEPHRKTSTTLAPQFLHHHNSILHQDNFRSRSNSDTSALKRLGKKTTPGQMVTNVIESKDSGQKSPNRSKLSGPIRRISLQQMSDYDPSPQTTTHASTTAASLREAHVSPLQQTPALGSAAHDQTETENDASLTELKFKNKKRVRKISWQPMPSEKAFVPAQVRRPSSGDETQSVRSYAWSVDTLT